MALRKYVANRSSLDLATSESLIEWLKTAPGGNANLLLNARLLEIDYLSITDNLPAALKVVETSLAQQQGSNDLDVYRRIRLLNAKCLLFARANQAHRGFSIITRTMVAARRCGNIHALWEASTVYAMVLTELGECTEALRIVENVICSVSMQQCPFQVSSCSRSAGDRIRGF